MVNNRYFLLSEGFLWWPSLSLWKGRDQGTLSTEPFFRLLEFWVRSGLGESVHYSRKTLLKSKKIFVEHALHVALIHSQQGFRPIYVFNYSLLLYYSMHKKIDLHQIALGRISDILDTPLSLRVKCNSKRCLKFRLTSNFVGANMKQKSANHEKNPGQRWQIPPFPWIYNPCKLGWHAVFTISAIDFLVVCTIYFAPYQPVSPRNFDVYGIVSHVLDALPELCHRKE